MLWGSDRLFPERSLRFPPESGEILKLLKNGMKAGRRRAEE